MATCRECLHIDICSHKNYQDAVATGKDKEVFITIRNNLACRFFTPKSDYVKRERGEWIVKEKHQTALSGSYIYKVKSYYCPYCKKRFGRRMKFCGECGADMRKEYNNAK